ncbi:hypothetical protein F2P79_006558, partial [Pimephales promelas]
MLPPNGRDRDTKHKYENQYYCLCRFKHGQETSLCISDIQRNTKTKTCQNGMLVKNLIHFWSMAIFKPRSE